MSTSSPGNTENFDDEEENRERLHTIPAPSNLKSCDCTHSHDQQTVGNCHSTETNGTVIDHADASTDHEVQHTARDLSPVHGIEHLSEDEHRKNDAEGTKEHKTTASPKTITTESNFTCNEASKCIDERTFLNKQPETEESGDIPSIESEEICDSDIMLNESVPDSNGERTCASSEIRPLPEVLSVSSSGVNDDDCEDSATKTSSQITEPLSREMEQSSQSVTLTNGGFEDSNSVEQNTENLSTNIPSLDPGQGRDCNTSLPGTENLPGKDSNTSEISNEHIVNSIKSQGHASEYALINDSSILGSPRDGSCPDSPNSFEPGTSSSSVTSAADSGVSSGVQDEDVDPDSYFNQKNKVIPPLLDEELFEKLQNDFDLLDNWTPLTRNTYEPCLETRGVTETCVETTEEQKTSQSRLKNLFGKSPSQRKSSGPTQAGLGWKLFGKVSKEARKSLSESESTEIEEAGVEQTESSHVQTKPEESQQTTITETDNNASLSAEVPATKKSPFVKIKGSKKNSPIVASSTTALILENRPSHLPPKNPKEEKKHREMYEAMIEEAKKKELRDLQQQKKKQKDMVKQENTISSSLSVWTNDILPNWETKKYSRKVRDMWWQGLPPSVRGKVWKLAIGNDLHITHELFEIFQSHACEKLMLANTKREVTKMNGNGEKTEVIEAPPVKEHAVELITLDVSRTFPSLGIFQKGGPYHNSLHTLLGAYTCYRPDVGYVQGMSFLAAVLLLNLEPADAFICFANLLNKPCQMAFFRVDQPMMKAYFAMFDVLLQENLPKLQEHFKKNNLSPDLYLFDWIFTLYSKSLPLDVACRVWDVFCRDGDELLFKTALGILSMYEEVLLKLDFIHLAQFLTKLPDDITGEALFQAMALFTFTSTKYKQILSKQKEKILQGDFDQSEHDQTEAKVT